MSAADRARQCVGERTMRGTSATLEREPIASVWHAAVGPGRNDFQPILCGIAADPENDEGINFPGWPEQRIPTCERCRKILEARGSVAAAVRIARGAS